VRVCICSRSGNDIRRVAWVSESVGGIFLGYYGPSVEHHHSIHTDGHRHLRTLDGKDLLPPAKGKPISEIGPWIQLLNASISLPPTESRSAAFSLGEKADVLAMVDTPTAAEPERVSLNYYLLQRSEEEEFLRKMVHWPKSASSSPHELTLCVTGTLEHFPSHKVAITIHRPVKL
jgi:hypothetical protein